MLSAPSSVHSCLNHQHCFLFLNSHIRLEYTLGTNLANLWGPETRTAAYMDHVLISPLFCQYTPNIAHVVSPISVFFQGSTYQDFIENIYSLMCIVFRQVLINNCILYIFFSFQVLLTDDCHFVFSSKIFPRGCCDCHLVFNVRS